MTERSARGKAEALSRAGVSGASPRTVLVPGGRTPVLRWAVASRVVSRATIGVLLLLIAAEIQARLMTPGSSAVAGMDFRFYRDATIEWLNGGSFYPPTETSGPFLLDTGAILYPPITLILFVPFVYLGAFLWSAMAAAIMAGVLWYHRPGAWAWVVILMAVAFSSEIQTLYWFGTPTIWIAAFLALATIWRWVSAFVLLKPAVFPFAAIGYRERRWWAAIGGLALVSLLFLPMWFDWISVLQNARGPSAHPFYAIGDLPLLTIPLVAWLAGRHPPAWVGQFVERRHAAEDPSRPSD